MANENEQKSLFQKFCDLMDRNVKGVQFSRFRKPSDIPNHFINERRELVGVVNRVEPNGVLLINHQPLVPLPGIRGGELPARIANVELSGHGVSWLQILVAGNEVKFTPVAKRDQFVECQFKLRQKTHDKKDRVIDLGVSLVSIGFGNLVESPIGKKDKDYKYYMQLISARENALRKKMGFRYYIKPTKLAFAMISQQVSFIAGLLSKRLFKKTPTNVPKAVAAV